MSGYKFFGNISDQINIDSVAMQRHHSVAFGSFGELIQGELPGVDNQFLVTCPINLGSRSTFFTMRLAGGVCVFPQNKLKVQRAVSLYLNQQKSLLSGILIINSDIPCGKGMASSSADIVSALKTLSGVLRQPLTPEEIENILREIEPSDGVMYEQSVIYNHRKVSLVKRLGALPEMFILAVDQGGEVDTIKFNRRHKEYSFSEKNQYATLLADLEKSVQQQDIQGLGRVSTISATLNQSRSPKLHFEWLKSLSEDIKSPGIICAHSGTMLGVILSPNSAEFEQQLTFACSEIKKHGLQTELVSTL